MSSEGKMPVEGEMALETFTRNGCHSFSPAPGDDPAVAELQHVWNRSGELKDSPSMLALRRQAMHRSRRPAARWATLARPSNLKWAAVAASIGAVLLLVTSNLPSPQKPADAGSGERFVTGPAEQRIIEMADGSQVRLDGRTEVTVAYDDSERRVSLVQGRAFFAVHHDAKRPMIVTAGGGQTVDLGTRFTVDREGDRVTVALIEGKVAVRSVNDNNRQLALNPGQAVSYRGAGTPERIAAISGDPLDWIHGTIALDDVPLSKAVRLLSRYSPTPIQLADDPSLSSRSVTGVFHTNSGAKFAETLASALTLRVDHRADGVAVLRAN